ncbi:hypothetical protein GALMADRAFT_126699 [Galerina marginata CBS 339.88]|uniref:Protein kinase domain-containing protein n=1 Tax=Galerina marginata (strain CBS 339.88) TaxID=685588 RepID=A0A067SP09_GALM3|nr:hypothetical protein GALMADRAFT_126699 [Galerina marginata CBS 339.88]
MLRHSFQAFHTTFTVDSEYQFIKELGRGQQGPVIAAKHQRSGEWCAIKKKAYIGKKPDLIIQCLREIKATAHVYGHRNIISLYDVDIVFHSPDSFDVYLFEELMETDLRSVIHSGQPLTDDHFQAFIYQTLSGIKYIHSAGILHQDLKPGHILVNPDCELKICDFGQANNYGPGSRPHHPTDIAMDIAGARWYRAPEIILSAPTISTPIDIWSVGCILAEFLGGGKPLFKGKDYVDHLNHILSYLGTPPDSALGRIASLRGQYYLRSLSFKPRSPFSTVFPHENPLAVDLLTQMLHIDPAERITCEQAINHTYLEGWYDPADTLICEYKCDLNFQAEENIDEIRKLLTYNVDAFRDGVRAQARSAEIYPRPNQ